jgi:hypothetical protein
MYVLNTQINMLNHAQTRMILGTIPGNIPHWRERQRAGWLLVINNNTDTCVLEVIRSCEAGFHSAEERATETTHIIAVSL